jgi:excinuclease ABC subunit C
MARFAAGDAGFAPLPDLLLIDGGAAHASAARSAIGEAGFELPVYGMVKDDRHKTRALATPDGEEIGIAGNPAVFALIGTIQEETHRFAVEYHRALRSKGMKKSALDEIPGIGEKRRQRLLKEFGTVKAISYATVEELGKVAPKNVAENIHAYFRKKGDGGA